MISWLRFGKVPLDPKYHDRARAALTRLQEQVEPLALPATDEQILNVLAAVAQVFQVELPDEDGLMIYTLALADVPEHLLKRAAGIVCRTHRFKSMPLPVEFLEPVKDEAAILAWYARSIRQWIASLT